MMIRFLILDGSSSPFSPEDFLNKLFPNFWSFLINFIALIVLFLCVYFLAYKPIRKFRKARADYVEKNLRDSEAAKAINERKAKESDAIVQEANSRAKAIVEKARKDAEASSEAIVRKAEDEAAKRLEEADEAIKDAERKSQAAIEAEIVNVALDASKKALGREVNEEDQKRLVKDFVSEASKEKE